MTLEQFALLECLTALGLLWLGCWIAKRLRKRNRWTRPGWRGLPPPDVERCARGIDQLPAHTMRAGRFG